jgi:rhamnosyltransferase subunit B
MQDSGKRVVLACFGSLGDLHPYIAIALALKRLGHRPVIAAMDRYRDAVACEGIEFAPVSPSEAQVGDPAALIRKLFDPLRGPEYLIRDLLMPLVRDAYEDLWRASEGADLLVSHPLTFALPLVAEKRGLPWASTVLSPMSLFSAYDPPLFPPAPWLRQVRRLGVAPYRLVFGIARRIATGWEQPLRQLRSDLGLPRSETPAQFEGQYSPLLNLALFPDWFAAPQPDWPARTLACGFARYDGKSPHAIDQRLQSFLDAGEPPVVFTLGSSVAMDSGRFPEHAVEASAGLGLRALLIAPDPEGHVVAAAARTGTADTMLQLDYAPYSRVFARACAVVHQCGIGTLAQAFAAGRPQLIVPVAFDQPDNARRAEQLGVARVLPYRRVTGDALRGALQALLAAPAVAASAAAVATAAAADGAAVTAEALIALLQGAGDDRDAVTPA